jgi:hypothetical protein
MTWFLVADEVVGANAETCTANMAVMGRLRIFMITIDYFGKLKSFSCTIIVS